jgi:hypothetical protein
MKYCKILISDLWPKKYLLDGMESPYTVIGERNSKLVQSGKSFYITVASIDILTDFGYVVMYGDDIKHVTIV